MQNVAIKPEGLEPEDFPTGSASRLAATYLRTMEAGDIAAAREMLTPGFTMTFPGNMQYTDLEKRGQDARLRYRNVRKVFNGETPTLRISRRCSARLGLTTCSTVSRGNV